jgi:LysM repeat protein
MDLKLKPIVLMVFLASSTVLARPRSSNISSTASEKFQEDSAALSSKILNLNEKIDQLQKEMNMLKKQSGMLEENQQNLRKELAANNEKMFKNIITTTDQHISVLSEAFSKNFNDLSEKLTNTFSRIIAFLNAVEKLSHSARGVEKQQTEGIIYEIQAGDVLESIAAKMGVSADAIAKNNFVPDTKNLQAGQMIFIPQTKL